VQRGPQGLYAWVLEGNDHVAMRPLKTSPVDSNTTIVTAGLGEGDRVVVNGQSKLQPGTAVTFTAPPPANVKSTEAGKPS